MAAPSSCQELREALLVMMEPSSSLERRTEAHRFCQEFRDTSLLCLPCGLALAEVTEAPVVRHFGLRLLGHVAEARWVILHLEERAQLKQRALDLISGAKTSDETYIKDAVVRLVVEVIKKDWPVSWPNMLSQLKILSWRGASQAQLVLLTLLRLGEDVATLENLPFNSSKVLKKSLLVNMASISSLVEDSLHGYWYKYKHRATWQSEFRECCCVVVAALNALAGYMEWAPMDHFTQNDCQLLKMLWPFLEDPKLQLEASECLLVAVQRISSGPGIPSLLFLFGDVPLRYLPPIRMAAGEGLTDQHYFHTRGQCLLICALIEQLCGTMDSNITVEIPSNLGQYLNILLGFTMHSSLFLSFLTQSPWRHIFEQTRLSSSALVRDMLPRYLHTTGMNLMKVGYPSMNDSPSCEYSRLEFGGDDDFSDFLSTFHDEQRMAIEAAFGLDQRTCYQIAFEYLKYLLVASVDPGPLNYVTSDTLCHASSQSFLLWEAVTFFVKVIVDNMFKILNKEIMPVDDCIELLQLVKNFKTEDPLILACVQTNISTLNRFLKCGTESSSQVLSRFLDMIDEIKAPKAQTLKSERRSECSRFIQMCRENAQNLLLDVGMLNRQVSQLLCYKTPMQMEKGTVMKAMVILINQIKNFQRQKALLEELMAPIASIWLSNDMQFVLSKPSALIKYVGASFTTLDTVMETLIDLNRSRIMDCVSSILGVLRWSRWPSDLEEARIGGFVVGYMHSGRPIYRNPCTELVQNLLNNFYLCLSTQHFLYNPVMISNLGYSFSRALYPLAEENDSTLDFSQPLLDIFDPPEYKTAPERMQAFFCTLHEACFSVLGHAGSSMNKDFYTITDSADRLFHSTHENRKRIPLQKLRTMVRVFLKPLVQSCPPEYYESFLCPVMKRFLDVFHARLSDEWEIINQRNMFSKDSTAVEITMSEKTLEIQVKLLTDELMEFLFACCVQNKGASVTTESSDACCKDADVPIAAGTSHDFCCVSEKEDDSVCAAECDDDISVCNDQAEAGVVSVVSDGYCCVSIENNDTCPDLDEGEMAAEVPPSVPQPASLKLSELDEITESTELTPLGLCFLKENDHSSSLLDTAFSSLVWNDSETCNEIASRLCWALLKQVISEPLSVKHMNRYLILVLRGIQKYQGHDSIGRDDLVNLAFHIGESLLPLHRQHSRAFLTAKCTEPFYLEKFNLTHFWEEIQNVSKITKEALKRLIEDCTKKPLGKMCQGDGTHTPAPPSAKKKNSPISDKDPDNCPPPAKKFLPSTVR